MKKILSGLLILLISFLPNSFAASTATCNDTDTKLMLHFEGADASTTFTDSSSGAKTMTAAGNAQIDTAQFVFGSASGLFDGTGDYVDTGDSADWDLGTGDFTIDFRVRFNVSSNQRAVIVLDKAFNTGLAMSYYAAGPSLYNYLEGTARTFSWTVTNNTWYHVALTRSGTNLRAFIDGTQIGTTLTDSTDIQTSNGVRIGSDSAGTLNDFNGWIDELRVVKGTAVWTANFTAPSAAYSDTCTVSRATTLFMD